MWTRGYSLVETLVLLGLIAIVLAYATPRFAQYLKGYRGEGQMRMIYAELQQARANALYLRRTTRVKLYRNRLEVYSSALDRLQGVAPVLNKPLADSITSNGNGDGETGYTIDFEVNGLATGRCSICLERTVGGGLDSLVVAGTRVRIGTKDKGDDCKSENITAR